MNAQTAARHATSPQTPSLPQAKPESIGLSPVRLQRMSDAFKREIDKGTLPGATVMVARKGQIGWFDALGKQSPAASAPMAHNTPVPHFLDDQADRLGRHHDAGRGRPSPDQRSRRKIHSRNSPTRRSASRATASSSWCRCKRPMTVQDLLRHTSGITYDHTGNSLVQQQYQQSRLRSRKITNAEHASHRREPAPDLPARRRMELQPLHRHPRPHHRGRLRQDAERVPHRAHSGAVADGRDRLPHG